jgi:Ricin-type beta-trefoil lectin domain
MIRERLRPLASLAGAAVAAVGFSTAAAAAPMPASHVASPAIGGTVTLRDLATGFCLDSNTSRNVYTGPCNGGSFQKWVVGRGTTLKDLATGFCLDSNTSRNVYTGPCNGGNFQNWNVSPGNTVTIRDVSTGFCLDSNTSRNVYTGPCNGGSFQKWVAGR